MNRTTTFDVLEPANRTIGETAFVALATSLGLASGSFIAVSVWSVTSGVPVAGYALSLAAALAVAVGLPAAVNRVGRSVLDAMAR